MYCLVHINEFKEGTLWSVFFLIISCSKTAVTFCSFKMTAKWNDNIGWVRFWCTCIGRSTSKVHHFFFFFSKKSEHRVSRFVWSGGERHHGNWIQGYQETKVSFHYLWRKFSYPLSLFVWYILKSNTTCTLMLTCIQTYPVDQDQSRFSLQHSRSSAPTVSFQVLNPFKWRQLEGFFLLLLFYLSF